jgi:hypothetical protein
VLRHKPKAEMHPGHLLTGPKEEVEVVVEEEEEEEQQQQQQQQDEEEDKEEEEWVKYTRKNTCQRRNLFYIP